MLFLRHSEKEKGTDPSLTKKGKELCHNLTVPLLEKYFLPKKIVTSPFRRCRETAFELQLSLFELTENVVPIVIDPDFGEYLGPSFRGKLTDETMEFNPFQSENLSSFHSRIKRISEKLEGETWYITHGLLVTTIGLFLGRIIKYPGYLSGFIHYNK